MSMLTILKLVFQAVCNPEDFKDSEKCREFVRNAIKIARTIGEKNTIEWDEKVFDQFDKIVSSNEIWQYCYELVSGWFGSDPNRGIDIDTDEDGKPIFTPEGVAGITTVIPILIQILQIIRLLRKTKVAA